MIVSVGASHGHGRIPFLSQLRGLAAIGVATSHLLGVFWLQQDVISAATLSPAQPGLAPDLAALSQYPWLRVGQLGVAFFFLISGFVIPFSLVRNSWISFARKRLLRIYPMYIGAFLLEMAAVYASAQFWGQDFTIDRWAILTNALLVYDVFGYPSLDLVNWSLAAELKFYLLALMLLPAFRRGRMGPLMAASATGLALNAALALGLLGPVDQLPNAISTLSHVAVCLAYMLVGTAFNFHYRGLITGRALLAYTLPMLTMFMLSWRLSVWKGYYPSMPTNYLVAAGLFAVAYGLRYKIPTNRALDRVASISFPFYLVHSLLGYSLLRALMGGAGWSYGAALAVTVPSLLGIATLLHWTLERPAIRLGQRLARTRTRMPMNTNALPG